MPQLIALLLYIFGSSHYTLLIEILLQTIERKLLINYNKCHNDILKVIKLESI